MPWKVKQGRGWATKPYRGKVMKYEYKTSKTSKAGYTISFWVHFEEDNSYSLVPSYKLVRKLVPVEAA